MMIIRQIAEAAKQQEYEYSLKIGYAWGKAVENSWDVYFEIVMLGREGILEGKGK